MPIPIHPVKGIYAIPTQGAQSFECGWLFYHTIIY
ncbi:hypothetical protein F9U64_11960 [Gracilibacillus oryzae]|uniref:Uncharacterized protein n=1 Tax=Gracilibacillus oryzae TaxID=1672701 RepID=A0A7C8GSX4_9BACI|nr:hypothetical protein F9U64_11960 [Gracilibacillus oryzae]